MKSLLVDALRQAQDGYENTAPAANEQAEGTPAEGMGVYDRACEESELNLLTTGAIPAAELPARVEHREAEQVSEAETSDDTDEYPNARRPAYTDAPEVSPHQSVIARIGRFAPILCVLAMSSSALAYLTYQRLAVVTLNGDLVEITARGTRTVSPNRARDVSEQFATAGFTPGVTLAPQAENGTSAPEVGFTPDADQAAGLPESPRQDTGVGGKDVRTFERSGDGAIVDDNAFAHVLAGFSAYREEEYAQAERHYTDALQVSRNHRDALAGLAAVYQRTSRMDEAVRIYERLLAIDHTNTVAASAILSIRSGSSGDDIESELKHLLQQFPQAPHLHFALGKNYAGQQRWPEARLAFLAAHLLAPENADYCYNLAVSMEQVGQYESARFYYEVALANIDAFSSIDSVAITDHLSQLTLLSVDSS